jgi:putative transposase
MAAEVTVLCGLKHSPSTSDHYRRAVARAVCSSRVNGRRLSDLGFAVKVKAVRAARSSWPPIGLPRTRRSYRLRSFRRSSRESAAGKFVETLRGKDLSAVTWCGLLLDGIRLSSDQTAVVAWGSITRATRGCWTLCLAAVKTRRCRGN